MRGEAGKKQQKRRGKRAVSTSCANLGAISVPVLALFSLTSNFTFSVITAIVEENERVGSAEISEVTSRLVLF